jgi:putative aminopeptidase FrvX
MKPASYACNAAAHRRHEALALELTAMPTAAGLEWRIQAFLDRWLKRRSSTLRWKRDVDGNLLITQRKQSSRDPIYFTAHLDHPGFVVVEKIDTRNVIAEFRGGVMDPYFKDAKVEFFDTNNATIRGQVHDLEQGKPFKRATIRFARNASSLAKGDVGRWALPKARMTRTQLKTNACDDLAAVAAALAAFDRIRKRTGTGHVGLLFTVAEEVGFLGAIGAARRKFVAKKSRLICLENSRSTADSPIGAGPVVRVGDRMTVFSPQLTNRVSEVADSYAKDHPHFAWQRKLMVGGACEATAFSALGYQSTCVCLPLGNYHNMERIDEVRAGKGPARVGQEFVSTSDFHGLVELLEVVAHGLDAPGPDLPKRLIDLRKRNSVVFDRR